jgi:hypothetical protein
MFDSTKNISARLTDAADLLIDFATLGEYGLEPVGSTTTTCESRHRRPLSPTTSRQRRPGAPTLVLATKEVQPRRKHRIEGPFLLRP